MKAFDVNVPIETVMVISVKADDEEHAKLLAQKQLNASEQSRSQRVLLSKDGVDKAVGAKSKWKATEIYGGEYLIGAQYICLENGDLFHVEDVFWSGNNDVNPTVLKIRHNHGVSEWVEFEEFAANYWYREVPEVMNEIDLSSVCVGGKFYGGVDTRFGHDIDEEIEIVSIKPDPSQGDITVSHKFGIKGRDEEVITCSGKELINFFYCSDVSKESRKPKDVSVVGARSPALQMDAPDYGRG